MRFLVRLVQVRGTVGIPWIQANAPQAQVTLLDNYPDCFRALAQGRGGAACGGARPSSPPPLLRRRLRRLRRPRGLRQSPAALRRRRCGRTLMSCQPRQRPRSRRAPEGEDRFS